MKVRVIGSSGTFPTPTNPASGYLVEEGTTRVWCDAGPGTFTSMPCDPELIDAVFISHRHPDHCADLFAAYHAWTYRPEPRTGVRLFANGDVLDHLSAFVGRRRGEAFGETFDLCEVEAGDEITEGEIVIKIVGVNHSVPALGSLWKGTGRSLFYSGDTGPGVWTEQVEGADFFMCEAALQGARGDADFEHHLTASEVGEIGRSAGVGKVILTHIPPYLDATVSVAEAERTFGKPVSLAVPGMTIEI